MIQKPDEALEDLPMRWGQNRGFSQDEPCTVSFPRLFPSPQSAQAALNRWLEGVWHIDPVQYDSCSGEYDGGDLYVTPVEGRRREDMEIVRFRLVDVEPSDPVAMPLDEKDRCCGRKPIVYKRARYRFCPRCDRAYQLENGKPTANWAWRLDKRGEHERVPRPEPHP